MTAGSLHLAQVDVSGCQLEGVRPSLCVSVLSHTHWGLSESSMVTLGGIAPDSCVRGSQVWDMLHEMRAVKP